MNTKIMSNQVYYVLARAGADSIGLYVEFPDFDSAYNVAEERIAQSYKRPFTVQALQLIDVGKREPSVRFKVQRFPLRLFQLRKNAAQMHGGAFESGLDFFGAYWLAEIVIHTRRKAKLAVFFHRIGGHGDNIWPFGRAHA